MASLVEYLRQRQLQADPNAENLLRSLASYESNKKVTQSLGGEDKSLPGIGLGKKVLNVLGLPGRLAQGALMEATGYQTPELKEASGLDEVRKLITGEISPSFGELPILAPKEGEGILPRIGRLGASFALDVATDPLSYVSAPASISRQAAAELAVRTAPALLDDVIRLGSKGESVIDDLARLSPKEKIGEAQLALGLEAAEGTPAAVSAAQGRRAIAEVELGNLIGESLLKGGRREVMRVLEDISGSRAAAMALFKKLPDQVRGGIVLTGITGRPLRGPGDQMVRLTQGTGRALGPVGDVANKVRLNAAAVSAGIRAPIKGRAGDVYAGVLRGIRQEAKDGMQAALGRDRLVDAFQIRDALGFSNFTRTQIEGRALAGVAQAVALAKPYRDTDAIDAFNEAYKMGVFSPTATVNETALSKAQRDGYAAARIVRKEIAELFAEAKAAGVDIGQLGDVETWSPLMLTDEAYDNLQKLGLANRADNPYRSTIGRRSMVEYRIQDDPELMARAGFTDPNNPGVLYLNAIEANKVMRERAIKLGKSVDEIEMAGRTFIEDPSMILQRYGNYVANTVANKKFLTRLINAGTIVKDVPVTRKLLNEKVAATFVASLQNLTPALREYATTAGKQAEEELAKLLEPARLEEVMLKISQFRRAASDAVKSARLREQDAIGVLDKASDAVDAAMPKAADIRARLIAYEDQTVENATNIRQAEIDGRRQRRLVKQREAEVGVVQERWAQPAAPEDVFDILELPMARAQVDAARTAKEMAQKELSAAKQSRNTARATEVETQLQQIEVYERALAVRNKALEQVESAREARRSAVTNMRKANEDLKLENVRNVEHIVNNYVESMNRVRIMEARIADAATADERSLLIEQLGNLKDIAKTNKQVVRELLSAATTKFDGAASEYGKALMRAAEKLSADQMDALHVLASESRIQKFIETYLTGGRDQAEVLAAMGDMYRTFASIRDKIPASVFNTLEDTQKNLISEGNYGSLVGQLFREEKTRSELADRLVGGGYAAIAAGRGTDELFAASGVLKVMKRIYDTERKPEGWSRFVEDVLDPLLALWKSSVTVGRGPGYTARNVSGGLYMNYLGNVSFEDHKLVFNALVKIKSALADVQRANPNRSYYDNLLAAEARVMPDLNRTRVADMGLGDLMQQLFLRGAFFDTEMSYAAQQVARLGSFSPENAFQRGEPLRRYYTAEAGSKVEEGFRSTVDFLMTNQVQKFFSDMAQTSEMFLRGAAFIDGYRKYRNLGAAIDQVHLLHFNYQDLGPGDLAIKRLMPFYVWARNNIPAQLRALVMQPGKIQKGFEFNEEFQNSFGAEGDDRWMNQVLPEYMNIANGFLSKFKFADNNIGLMQSLPINDIDRLLSGDGFPIRGREVAGMFGPFTVPLELLSGQNFGGGAPFRESGEEVPDYYRLLSLVPYAGIREGEEGKTYAAPAVARGFGDLIPQLGLVERLASFVPGVNELVSTQSQRDKARANLLNLTGISGIAGYTTTVVTPKTINAELTRRIKKQQSNIAVLAEQAGVDLDWVREQLRNGATPEQVKALLEYGYGQAEETQKSTLKPATRRKYLDILEGYNA